MNNVKKSKGPSKADLLRRIAELEAQHASTCHFATQTLDKAGDAMMASAVIVRLTALGGREIIPAVAIRDGLSSATLTALRADIVRSWELATALKPKGGEQMSKNWIVIDLDGTLCDCSHRVHWAQAKQWDEFHAGIPQDIPNEDVMTLLALASENYNILICTGRNEAHRFATTKWLGDNGIGDKITEVLMRPDDSRLPDHELKPALVYDYFGGREQALESVMLVLDDRDKVVEAWRNDGFKCWQVQQGSY